MDEELHFSCCQEQFSKLNVFGRPKVLGRVHSVVSLLMFYVLKSICCCEMFVSFESNEASYILSVATRQLYLSDTNRVRFAIMFMSREI